MTEDRGRLTDAEFKKMLRMLRRHCSHDVDQFEHFRLTDSRGIEWFVEILMMPRGAPEVYNSVDRLIDEDPSPKEQRNP